MKNSRREVIEKISKTTVFVLPALFTLNIEDLKAIGPQVSGANFNTEHIENNFNKFFAKWKNTEFEGKNKDEWETDKKGWYSAYLKWSQLRNHKIW